MYLVDDPWSWFPEANSIFGSSSCKKIVHLLVHFLWKVCDKDFYLFECMIFDHWIKKNTILSKYQSCYSLNLQMWSKSNQINTTVRLGTISQFFLFDYFNINDVNFFTLLFLLIHGKVVNILQKFELCKLILINKYTTVSVQLYCNTLKWHKVLKLSYLML